MVHFIWECLGVDRPLYRWADPLGRNPYGVQTPGQEFPWHFDGNEFTVSMLAQKADQGGVFEYVPNIRRPDAENFEHVAHILAGGRDGVRELDLIPGDLQLFAGRYSLHRVTPIVGATTRYIGLPVVRVRPVPDEPVVPLRRRSTAGRPSSTSPASRCWSTGWPTDHARPAAGFHRARQHGCADGAEPARRRLRRHGGRPRPGQESQIWS